MEGALVPWNEAEEVIPVSAADAKAWELVSSVLDWMGANCCYNYSEAFRQLDVAPASYYRAIQVPFVQGRITERMSALDKATAKLLEVHWPAILVNMARLAQGEGREAVQATRFLAEEKQRLEEKAGPEERQGMHPAERLLQTFGQSSRMIKARRTSVEEEIQVTD